MPLAERIEFVFDHSRRRLEMDAAASRAVTVAALERGRRLARELAATGDPALDGVDWVSWGIDDPRRWRPRSDALAAALACDATRLWAWCAAFAAMLAAAEARAGAGDERVGALLALGP